VRENEEERVKTNKRELKRGRESENKEGRVKTRKKERK
jgi:hypothetical protein